MRTAHSPQNPYPLSRYSFLWEILSLRPAGRHLDYGTYDGKTLATLIQTGVIREGVGVDVNTKALDQARSSSDLTLINIQAGQALPFPDNSFDSVSVLDVIEHVVDQKHILTECLRVLKPRGVLVVTVPGKHLFSFFDVGNFKFRFPQLHRWYVERKHSPAFYQERYVDCPNGLIGDIEKAKAWHQHFSRRELKRLLENCGVEELRFDGCGFFNRPLELLALSLPKPFRGVIDWVLRWDEKTFAQTHLYSCGSKPVAATSHHSAPAQKNAL